MYVRFRVLASVGRFFLGLAWVFEPMFSGLAIFIKMENFASFSVFCFFFFSKHQNSSILGLG